ncbi:hypothetical protein [Moorena sp. SIO4A5]|uniref:hypothetical protein n=1 Tax=Moorena sp. SIO4A5 TaxID=2607838 RepID=UPI0013CB9F23|nr:hypothetical protein [Moorena sp. SIO4A5]NEO21453.1 hypothetical protein [Moorena sp. SIO4A5]
MPIPPTGSNRLASCLLPLASCLLPIPYSLFPVPRSAVPCSLKPRTLYLTQFKTAILLLSIQSFIIASINLRYQHSNVNQLGYHKWSNTTKVSCSGDPLFPKTLGALSVGELNSPRVAPQEALPHPSKNRYL